MNKPLLHSKTEQTLIPLLDAHLPHAILLSGQQGIGLRTIAQYIAASHKSTPYMIYPEKNEKVDREAGVITAEAIRGLYDVTKTVETGTRIVVIVDAERMGTVAQNAFLKLLEEPQPRTHFILLSKAARLLLPTIRSRVQQYEITPLTDEQSREHMAKLGVTDPTRIAQLLFIAGGLPSEMKRLAEDDTLFEQRATIVRDARTYLAGDEYDKLLIAHRYKDSRPKSLLLVEDAMRLLKRTIAESGDARTLAQLDQFLSIHERLLQNGNVRLQLSTAVV